jgi:APA family basic amino acid/polyamine antiporter
MIFSLWGRTLFSAFAWMIIGLIIYFGFSKNSSKLKT